MSVMQAASIAQPSRPSSVEAPSPEFRNAGVELVSEAGERERSRQLASSGFLVARTARVAAAGANSPDLPVRGALREAIEGAVEMALALRGAVPPNVAVGVSCKEMARDQLFRIRALGSKGLCLVVPELTRLTDEDGELAPADSEALRVWRKVSETESVVLLLDEADRGVCLHVPMAVDSWLAPLPSIAAPKSVRWAEDERDIDDGFDRPSDFDFDPDELVLLDDAPLEAAVDEDDVEEEPARAAVLVEPDRPTTRDGARNGAAKLASQHASDDDAVMRHDPLAGLEDEMAAARSELDLFDGLFTGTPMPTEVFTSEAAVPALFNAETPSPTVTETAAPKRKAAAAPKKPRGASTRRAMARALDTEDHAEDDASQASFEPSIDDRSSEPFADQRRAEAPARQARRFDTAKLREHVSTLTAAKGSRPVKQIENLYVEHYAPLLEAVSAGYDERDAERALAGWRTAFEKSYQESFASIKVTGKRPKMVLDAPEEAIRAGKQHGARSVQLVLVDAMRYGLGERVQRRLQASMSDIGTSVEKQVLWSALPSVTSVQMQLLSQGARALREIQPPTERDLTAFRDGTACIPRRERIGQRDLLKLDVVEARLRDAGGSFETRMDDLAEEVADALVKVAEGLPPRTMMYVFGDHGFFLRSTPDGRTAKAEQGGARPEEVLVPGYAWLIGGPN